MGLCVGCGGGDDTLLREATVDELRDLCEYANDHTAPAATCDVDGEQLMIEAEAPSDCSMVTDNSDLPATCDASIGDAKACIDAIEADPCSRYGGSVFPEPCLNILAGDCIGALRSRNSF